ncbi:hypothetical protein CAOG_06177 [Capsaspora owczarzaki ATCC 30864]|uniref:Uncharacterized protein n=1 Tax=Capsaspora owczarzaki (strain ATCC 30864) TaxID=595528 RepID=A0A0D2VW64_CAPO3|nr:hypothetical protein CAOG_06177 [Capsaspora owczarzaki ATCC 30864]KJE95762.1 hypothetical protein CAOG_006177 [Capsaspora owczarzaki ATCC 30864]|eukprot:XP_004345767.1 hypothetical protein CAOG_06177 [Capsaspora owczarzaki ATCC 30864]
MADMELTSLTQFANDPWNLTGERAQAALGKYNLSPFPILLACKVQALGAYSKANDECICCMFANPLLWLTIPCCLAQAMYYTEVQQGAAKHRWLVITTQEIIVFSEAWEAVDPLSKERTIAVTTTENMVPLRNVSEIRITSVLLSKKSICPQATDVLNIFSAYCSAVTFPGPNNPEGVRDFIMEARRKAIMEGDKLPHLPQMMPSLMSGLNRTAVADCEPYTERPVSSEYAGKYLAISAKSLAGGVAGVGLSYQTTAAMEKSFNAAAMQSAGAGVGVMNTQPARLQPFAELMAMPAGAMSQPTFGLPGALNAQAASAPTIRVVVAVSNSSELRLATVSKTLSADAFIAVLAAPHGLAPGSVSGVVLTDLNVPVTSAVDLQNNDKLTLVV